MENAPDIFDIDQGRLDEEWKSQSRLYYDHATQLADARRTHAEAKAALDLAEAELKLAVRQDPDQFGLEKATEASVTEAVTVHKTYRKVQAKAIQAKHSVDLLEAAVYALDHRKRALEKLVELFLSNYWSEPKARNVRSGVVRKHLETVEDEATFGKRRGKTR